MAMLVSRESERQAPIGLPRAEVSDFFGHVGQCLVVNVSGTPLDSTSYYVV